MVEHHLIACGDFAPARQVLSEALPFLFGHLSCPPLYLLLHRAETLDFAQPPLNRLLAVLIGFALIGGEEGELNRGHCLFEPVKPVVIHLGKEEKEEAGQPHCGQDRNTDTGKGSQTFSSSRSNEGLETEAVSKSCHESAKGCHHSSTRGEIPRSRGNKTENAD